MRILFIGGDPAVAERVGLAVHMRWPHAVVDEVATGNEVLSLLASSPSAMPDVIAVCPDFSDIGFGDFLRELRRISNVVLLALQHRDDNMEVVLALETGADDYVRRPYSLLEIGTRIAAKLRRAGTGVSGELGTPLQVGELLVNPATQEVFLGERALKLTNTEFRLLHALMWNRGTIVPHRTLAQLVWGEDTPGPVKKYVQRLRGKLGETPRDQKWIMTVHGVGYRFVGPTN